MASMSARDCAADGRRREAQLEGIESSMYYLWFTAGSLDELASLSLGLGVGARYEANDDTNQATTVMLSKELASGCKASGHDAAGRCKSD